MTTLALGQSGFLPGYRYTLPVVALAALAATDNTIMTLPTGTGGTGARARITTITGWNGTGTNAQWTFGYTVGVTFTQVFPILLALNGFDNEWGEGTNQPIPGYLFDTAVAPAIIARTNVAIAGQQIMIEVEIV